MKDSDYGQYGKGLEGYVHYTQAVDESRKGGGGGGRPSGGGKSGCSSLIIIAVIIIFILGALGVDSDTLTGIVAFGFVAFVIIGVIGVIFNWNNKKP